LANNVLASSWNSKNRRIWRKRNEVNELLISVQISWGRSVCRNEGSIDDCSHWFLGGLSLVGPKIDREECVKSDNTSAVAHASICEGKSRGPLIACKTSNIRLTNIRHVSSSKNLGSRFGPWWKELSLGRQSLLNAGGIVHLLGVNDVVGSIFNDGYGSVGTFNIKSSISSLEILIFSKEKGQISRDNVGFDADGICLR